MEWDFLVVELCKSYGRAELAYAKLQLSLAENEYIEIRDARGSLIPLNRETLQMLIVW